MARHDDISLGDSKRLRSADAPAQLWAGDEGAGAAKNVIILGPPGSGKGVQARVLASRTGATHISVGALLRAEVASGSVLGRRIEASLAAGDLVSFDDVLAVLIGPLVAATLADGWILDGAPRTIEQARTLEHRLAALRTRPPIVIALEVPTEEISARLGARARVEGRVDDTETTVAHRLDVWTRAGLPVLEWYEQQHRLTRVDAVGDIATVADRIASAIQHAGHDLASRAPAVQHS